MIYLKYLTIALAVVLAASSIATARADTREEVEMINRAAISLSDAIALAEKEIGGKALAAEIDDDSFAPVFEVKVFKDGRVYDVRVDGVKAVVIDSREDRD